MKTFGLSISIGVTMTAENLEALTEKINELAKVFGDNAEAEITVLENVVYNIDYLRKNGDVIDSTQLDENNPELIWDMFNEFGHERKKGDYYEVEETTETE